jgi:copper resistance protein C
MYDLHTPVTSALAPRLVSLFLLALFLVFPLSAGIADAHALLDHADPRVGNTVRSPRMVSLWFTQNLESAFSDVQVLDAGGARVSTGRGAVDTSDRKLLRVPVKALPAGKYTVKWHVLSVDTHTTEGNFTFNVEP